jgi:hypothetical protein
MAGGVPVGRRQGLPVRRHRRRLTGRAQIAAVGVCPRAPGAPRGAVLGHCCGGGGWGAGRGGRGGGDCLESVVRLLVALGAAAMVVCCGDSSL